jgi:parallel beta-helix repeat protein
MSLPTVAVVVNLYDGTGVPLTTGAAVFTPLGPVTVNSGLQEITPAPVTEQMTGGLPSAAIIPTDIAGSSPPGWAWQVAFPGVPGEVAAFTFQCPAGPVAFTAAAGTPGVVTWTASGAVTAIPNGCGVQFTGTAPAGTTTGTTYYVTGAAGQTLGVAATVGGTPIVFTGTGTGTLAVVSYLLSGLTPLTTATGLSAYMTAPGGTAAAGQVPVATGSGGASEWTTPGASGVASVTAADASLVVGGSGSAPTVRTGTLDAVAAQHPPVAAVPFGGQKATGLANGSGSTDAVAFGQLGTAAFQASSAFDASGLASSAQSAAEAASLPLPSGTPASGQVPVVSVVSPLALGWGAGGGSNPLTAAGDTLYGGASGVQTRLAGNTALTRKFYREAGTGSAANAPAWDTLLPSDIPGATVPVPVPTGATATDTPAVAAAVANLVAALSFGPASILFQDGTYVIDSNTFVVQSVANFSVRSTGRTVLQQAPNRSALPNNTTGNIVTIADCTDFTVMPGIVLDGNRDTVSPTVPLTASAASAQPSVTVAAGQAAHYQVGQALYLFGGIGAGDAGNSEGFGVGAGIPLVILSITPGGGTAGGDLITFTTNLVHTWSVTGGTAVSDGFGPIGWTSDHLTPYQCATANTVAGRTLGGEDQQNGLHLISCQRFSVSGVTAKNTWESPIKMGTGERPGILSIGDACSQGSVTDCVCYHAYDQGVSVWLSNNITISGCTANAAGWGGIVLTASDYCTVVGNRLLNSLYEAPGDTSAGHGFVIEGGHRNHFAKNIVTKPNGHCVRTIVSPLFFGLGGSTVVTVTGFLEAGTAAGTSILVSGTANLLAGGLYSLVDQERCEPITVATIVDGTHITLAGPVQFSHAAGNLIARRIAQENVIEGNTLRDPVTGHGINAGMSARCTYKNNVITGWGSASYGIAVFYGSTPYLPSSAYTLGAPGSIIEGNTMGGGGNCCINGSGANGLTIRGNRMTGGALNAANSAMDLKGLTDSLVEGNTITEVWGSYGMRVIAGGPGPNNPARNTIRGNRIERCQGAGMLLQSADSHTVAGNIVSSCGGNGGIDLQGVSNSDISGNLAVANHNAGIIMEDNGAVHSLNNRVHGNTCRDDGSGYNVATGATWVQARGIYETGSSNFNLITLNEADTNGTAQIVTAGAGSYAWNNSISGAIAAGVAPPQGYYAPAGLTGAVASSRYAGATASGAPVSGTFAVGDWIIDQTGAIWICTAAGSPGTWTETAGGGGSAADYAPSGLTGATAASRYAGATASGAPVSGTFAKGDFVADQTGAFWVCTTAGTPGTWTAVSGSGGGLTNPMSAVGDTIYGGTAGAATRLAGSTSATPKVLGQTGTGSAATAPAWVLPFAANLFGDGSDGAVTLDGTTTFNGWSALAGSVYTMSRDVFCTTLVVNSGVTLKTNGWRVFGTVSIANAGTISSIGGSGSGATAGASPYSTPNCMFAGNAGGAGGTGAGAQGGNSGSGLGTGTGSAGGAGTSGAGGTARAFRSAITSMFRNPSTILAAVTAFANATIQVGGGYGGGSGAGDGTNSGGAAGGGGGVIALLAPVITNTGTISAAGGAGATPATGNCGGGAGGGGGLILPYTLTPWAAGTTSVAGGTQGSGVGTGAAGTAGTAGTVLNVVVQ